ncbi:thioredoxin family protein [Leptolyngbya cf. ectocarpi LEGE 11479]|uniref:Thioredoxin family protein n=1 Tax=Leptolyngbya cf. ectocarpi LEGE 11479 TaxID=1828722 RepID=A0A929FCS6_LEPEC|nr:thioredoxin family protein [Leptolyngbya ectocarpi]MBE9070314.1 thioredoxin family protein [Leptolyngbya cf. ectocarpi LEGE 11479]
MVMVESTMLALGTAAPAFLLTDVTSGSTVTLEKFADSKALLVMFICVHCPFVKHVEQELAKIGQAYANQGLGIVAISSNSLETHPQDAPEHMKTQAKTLGFKFPYCFDDTQTVAKTYTAACTPDFFLFDGTLKLVYRGQLDDSRPGNNKPVTGKDLRQAIDRVLAGETLPEEQTPSIGCNIKWAPGEAPAYFGA